MIDRTYPFDWESIPVITTDNSWKDCSILSNDFLTVPRREINNSLDVLRAEDDLDLITGFELEFSNITSANFLFIWYAISYGIRFVVFKNKLSYSLRTFKMYPMGVNCISEGSIMGDLRTYEKKWI